MCSFLKLCEYTVCGFKQSLSESLTANRSCHNFLNEDHLSLSVFFSLPLARNGEVKGEIHSLGSLNFGFPAFEIRLYMYIVLNRNLTSILFSVLPKQFSSQRSSNHFIRNKREFCWKITFHCQRSDSFFFFRVCFRIRVLLYCK